MQISWDMNRNPSFAFAPVLLAVAVGNSNAAAAVDQYQPLQYPAFDCSVAAMDAQEGGEVPVVSGPRAKDFPELAALGADIVEFWDAYRRGYEGYQQGIKLSRGHCPRGEDFSELMSLHKDALGKRKDEMVGPFPEDMIGYVSVDEFAKRGLGKEKGPDAFGLRTACRRPDLPPKIKSPVLPAGAAPAAAKILAELREATAEFYRSQVAVHAAHVRLMDLGEAYNCRELHMSYQSHVRRFYEAFYARREADLARIMDASLTWEQVP